MIFRNISDLIRMLSSFYGVGPSIVISNNKNSIIKNNTFSINNLINIEGEDVCFPEILGKIDKTYKAKNIINECCLVENNNERARKNAEIFDITGSKFKGGVDKPIIRAYGLFSNLSTNRNKKSKKTEYDLLMLDEVNLFRNLIESGFPAKICISLDIEYLVKRWGYSIEEIQMRIDDLCETINYTMKKSKNLDVTVDDCHRMSSLFIIGDMLSIKAINIKQGEGYMSTIYENDKVEIYRDIAVFDQTFRRAQKLNIAFRALANINTEYDMIKNVTKIRIASLMRGGVDKV